MQETNLYSVTIPPMRKSLTALSRLLDKAHKHAQSKQPTWLPKGTMEQAILNDRIIFDQFPFKQQVQIACDNAKGAAARLAGVKMPVHKDNEKSFNDLKARIDKTIAFLAKIKPSQIAGKEDVKITLPYWGGKHMTGFEYVTEYLMPNFYFHVTTAYSILRKNGIEVGKYDYIIDMPLKD